MSELGDENSGNPIDIEEYKQRPSSSINDYSRLIQSAVREDSYDRKVKLLEIVNNITAISDSIPDSFPSGLLNIVDESVRNIDRRQSLVFTDYEKWGEKDDLRSLTESLESHYNETLNLSRVSENNKYIVYNDAGDVTCEIYIGSEDVYISDYHLINKFVMDENERKLVELALRGLIKCYSKGESTSLRVVDWCLFYLTEFPKSEMSRLSCLLIEELSKQRPSDIVPRQRRVFNGLTEAHKEGNERAFKSIYKVAGNVHPEIENEDGIVDYLKQNIVKELHGSDRKMCRAVISQITGESRLKLYYREVTGKI